MKDGPQRVLATDETPAHINQEMIEMLKRVKPQLVGTRLFLEVEDAIAKAEGTLMKHTPGPWMNCAACGNPLPPTLDSNPCAYCWECMRTKSIEQLGRESMARQAAPASEPGPNSLDRAIQPSGPIAYRGQVIEARIGGVDVRFVVEFAEPITDPAKLPRLRVETR